MLGPSSKLEGAEAPQPITTLVERDGGEKGCDRLLRIESGPRDPHRCQGVLQRIFSLVGKREHPPGQPEQAGQMRFDKPAESHLVACDHPFDQ